MNREPKIDNQLIQRKALFLLDLNINSNDIPTEKKEKFEKLLTMHPDYINDFYKTLSNGKVKDLLKSIGTSKEKTIDEKYEKIRDISDDVYDEVVNVWGFKNFFNLETSEEIYETYNNDLYAEYNRNEKNFFNLSETNLDDFQSFKTLYVGLVSQIQRDKSKQFKLLTRITNITSVACSGSLNYDDINNKISIMNYCIDGLTNLFRDKLELIIVDKFKDKLKDNLKLQRKVEVELIKNDLSIFDLIELSEGNYDENEIFQLLKK